MTNRRGCLAAFPDALVAAAGIDSTLMTNGRGCPAAFPDALISMTCIRAPSFCPQFLWGLRAFGSAHIGFVVSYTGIYSSGIYGHQCIVTPDYEYSYRITDNIPPMIIWNSLSLRFLPLESCEHILATSHSAWVHISRGPEAVRGRCIDSMRESKGFFFFFEQYASFLPGQGCHCLDKAVTAWTRLSLPVIDAFSSWTVMRY